jgi:phosphoketolase
MSMTIWIRHRTNNCTKRVRGYKEERTITTPFDMAVRWEDVR